MPATYTAVGSNFGRGVDVDVFRGAVLDCLEHVDGDDQVVWMPTELDEADKPMEHKEFLRLVGKALDGREKLVGWHTYEPIVLSSGLILHEKHVIAACAGLAKFTPDRFFVEALVSNPAFPDVPPVLFRNHHPPINRVQTRGRRAACRQVHRQRTAHYWKRGITQVDSGDYNDARYPEMRHGQVDIMHRHYDYVRKLQHPRGAQLKTKRKIWVPGSIDNHDYAIWKFSASAPRKLR